MTNSNSVTKENFKKGRKFKDCWGRTLELTYLKKQGRGFTIAFYAYRDDEPNRKPTHLVCSLKQFNASLVGEIKK